MPKKSNQINIATDLKTIKAMEDVKAGRSQPIDDLLQWIEDDLRAGEEIAPGKVDPAVRKTR
jgi:hypothetical protein